MKIIPKFQNSGVITYKSTPHSNIKGTDLVGNP